MALENLSLPTAVMSVDVAGDMPEDWVSQIHAVASSARDAVLTGDNPTSLEQSGTSIRYGLVDGLTVADRLPWLDVLYRGKWLDYAAHFMGVSMVASSDARSAININVVAGGGGRYEWHVDSNPCTALLFASSLGVGDGGELVFRRDDTDFVVRPRLGRLLLFDARSTPHAVRRVRRERQRVSVPMNFFIRGDGEKRAESLDAYLYANQESE